MSAPFKDATNDAVQFLTKHGDLTRAAAYDAIRLLTGNGFVVTQTDMLPSATDLSQAAVAAALEAAAAICADHMAVALQDEKDPEALKGYARGMYFAARQQGIEIRAQITQPQHDALAAHVAAEVAKARVEDAAMVDALSACKQVAETAREYSLPQMVMGANKCHDDISDLRIHAHAILALRDKPAPGVTVRDSFAGLIADARTEAEKAMKKFPQPNYVLLKVAEEAGEVVKAGVHFAEGRETRENVKSEMIQTIAMLYRLWVEGDQVNGVPPIAGGGDE